MTTEITDKKVDVKKARFFCGDKNADALTFSIAKTYNGVSLVGVPVYVKTRNILGDCRKKLLTATENDDKLVIEWKLGKEATAVSGRLACQISFERDDGTLIFNTQMFYVYIGESIPDDLIASDGSGSSYASDIYSKLARFEELTEAGLVSSVNEKKGNVTLTAADVGALADGSDISLLINDAGYVVQTDIDNTIATHDGSTTAHADIRALINNVKTVAEKGTVTVVYQTAETMVAMLNGFAATKFKAGDCIRIRQSGVPDFYVTRISSTQKPYVFTTVKAITESCGENGELQIGYFFVTTASGSGGTGLPDVAAADAGKILKVSDDGEWAVVLPDVYDGSTTDYISFHINGFKYYAEPETDWISWCDTAFNTKGFAHVKVDGAHYIVDSESKKMYISGLETPISALAFIAENEQYVTMADSE